MTRIPTSNRLAQLWCSPILVTLLCLVLAGEAAAVLLHVPPAGMGPNTLQRAAGEPCPRPDPESRVTQPENLHSVDGILRVELAIRNHREADGSVRYCYVLPDGNEAPTLRVHPGDLLVLRLHNELIDLSLPGGPTVFFGKLSTFCRGLPQRGADPCSSGAMSEVATNLHFHGMTVPPVCHQDEVLKTAVQPGDPPFEYRIRIPTDEPPGLYWYHPHIHGFSALEVSGGASGALIVEGVERVDPELAGLPERVLIIRDMQLMHPDAPPSKSEPVVPRGLIDRDGDALNNNTGFGKPARDLSINGVPVPYPDYPPASLRIEPRARQLWRVLNSSAVTYLNLQVVYRRFAQPLDIVSLDGVPLHFAGGPGPRTLRVDHIALPPGARAEFVVEGPDAGIPAVLITRSVDTGPAGENDPNRVLARLGTDPDAGEPDERLASHPQPWPEPKLPWLGAVQPVRIRRLYFSEEPRDPRDPNSPTVFYLTVEGQTPKPFDPRAKLPDIVVHQGDVEDWIIENRSTELHAFHIHQLHFQVQEWLHLPVNEPFLRDIISVPYFNDRMLAYPSVRLRMDFRDPNMIGTFVYHCHLLEHEDGGMMGTIRVEPLVAAR